MKFAMSFLGIQLRPVVLCAAGFSAVAVGSFLVHRWRVRAQQETTCEAETHPAPRDGLEDQDPYPMDQDVFEAPLSLIPKPRQDLHKANRMFAYTFSRWFSADAKVVEVKLQHKSIYSGLESEHWWVLNNEFYYVHAELPLQHYASVNAVACIKRRGSSITEATVYLRTESSTSSVQNVFMQTSVSMTFKGVSIDSDGLFRSTESSHTQTLETPMPTVIPTQPRPPAGPRPPPPPGF